MWEKAQLRKSVAHALTLLTVFARCGLALDPTQPAGSYIRTDFTVEDGLPSNVVNAILQTRNGFLWIGTDAGLARFNGRHFKLIDFRGPRSAAQGSVRTLAEGPDGDLWVGTHFGLARIPSTAPDGSDKWSSTFYHQSGKRDEITRLKFSHDGTLWVGTEDGLFRFDRGRFAPILSGAGVGQIEELLLGRRQLEKRLSLFLGRHERGDCQRQRQSQKTKKGTHGNLITAALVGLLNLAPHFPAQQWKKQRGKLGKQAPNPR